MALIKATIPRLENGDHLTRAEFERRYNAMPEDIKADLIEGVVYLSAHNQPREHCKPRRQLLVWLFNYGAFTDNADCVAGVTIRLDSLNEPQPDFALYIEPAAGGQIRLGTDEVLELAPELIVEVASSQASIELHDKLNAYHRTGVLEYLVWRVTDNQLDWYVRGAAQYVCIKPDKRGVIRSQVFPGLWLNVRALLKDEMKKVLDTLQQGLASKEHVAFVKQLKAQRRRKTK